MKNNYKFLKKVLFLVSFFAIFISSEIVYSQGLQIDMSYGSGPTFAKIYHEKYYFKFYDKISHGSNNSYFIGLTKKIKANFFLRTEIGLFKTHYKLRIDYEYNPSLGILPNYIESNVLLLYITNERLYLSLLPEFRYTFKKIDFFINTGILVASDLKNTFYFSDTGHDNDELVIFEDGTDRIFGFSVNGGVNINLGSMALKLNMGSIFFNKSLLFSLAHPYLGYTNTRVAFGLVYSINKDK